MAQKIHIRITDKKEIDRYFTVLTYGIAAINRDHNMDLNYIKLMKLKFPFEEKGFYFTRIEIERQSDNNLDNN